ncbi:MAG: hypothetical protein RLZ95_1150 [Bacteroidota bacterium]|jgi:uncharacterized protein
MEWIGYLASILIGISLGLIGSGGSILTVPVLVYLFHIDPILATTYSLCIVGVSSIAGVISRLRQKLLDIKVILVFGAPSILGVFIARKFILNAIPAQFSILPNTLISKSSFIMLFFATLMLVSALSMILGKNSKEVAVHKPVYGLTLGMVGLIEGIVTGIVGAGGGFLIIPALVLLGKLSMKTAIASSLFIITIKSLVGFGGDILHVTVDWKFLSIIVALATLGIITGNYLNKTLDGAKLKKGFGWFVLIMALVILYEQFFI